MMDEKNDIFEGICGACKRTLPKDLEVYGIELIKRRATRLPGVCCEEPAYRLAQICPYCGTIKVVNHD